MTTFVSYQIVSHQGRRQQHATKTFYVEYIIHPATLTATTANIRAFLSSKLKPQSYLFIISRHSHQTCTSQRQPNQIRSNKTANITSLDSLIRVQKEYLDTSRPRRHLMGEKKNKRCAIHPRQSGKRRTRIPSTTIASRRPPPPTCLRMHNSKHR